MSNIQPKGYVGKLVINNERIREEETRYILKSSRSSSVPYTSKQGCIKAMERHIKTSFYSYEQLLDSYVVEVELTEITKEQVQLRN